MEEFLGNVAGFGWLQGFISQWIKLDITTIAAAVTILGTLSGVFQFLHSFAVKVYWYVTRFFTASVSINARDKLNREVLNWVGSQVLAQQGARVITARSSQIHSDAFFYYRRTPQIERIDYEVEKRKPIQYLPTFGSTWFRHDGNVFIVRRVSGLASGASATTTSSSFMDNVPDEFASAPEGTEPLVVMCLGRSVEPVKRFLSTCQKFAEKQRGAYVTIRVSKSRYDDESWETTILRPIRPIETIHFDEETKASLVADIKSYLDPVTRKFYTDRGIPYRRGYLLHGPAGTGKTSLSMALAGLFGLELYLLHLPSVRGDYELEKLFTALPPRCFILLEDIDAVGIKNRGSFFRRANDAHQSPEDDNDEEEDDVEDDDSSKLGIRSSLSLSGLLNVLDGVASQEGRIVLMTSNFAERLDRALVRPGRIDRMIFLGNISQRSAELMFMRMYDGDSLLATSHDDTQAARVSVAGEEELKKLALQFGRYVKADTFTPAQLQGYLLNHCNDPRGAVEGLDKWMAEEEACMEENKKRLQEAARARRKRKEKQLRLLLWWLFRPS
ncbi:P-loop containing nucleoside triphosphate hydrolase protein [Cryphonectria parasitica EP155]|uniref:P-loop containing nucleoside triphosphate hydrolase protein n=1 Tax=Cryphonectria parasitica (strain ATCC 38755 / EP155) TaxID=660469 RepID=A0A9P5CQF3_CRYP1|nr:P-loop containing nucleoside triphosphate hydrolase protein [Cryphonectria parasitica EP155]KAF3766176.1 P-loop containing nucleoside triphosphate hydrolase protein [Cryphonectria parasitica EP155]